MYDRVFACEFWDGDLERNGYKYENTKIDFLNIVYNIFVLIKISNVCTVGAFLAVILNLTVKEYYRFHSLEKLAAERKEIIKDIIMSIQEDSQLDSSE